MKIADGCVSKITVPPGKAEVFAWDDKLPSFGIRLKANGKAAYVVRLALPPTNPRHTIGNALERGNLIEVRKFAEKALRIARKALSE